MHQRGQQVWADAGYVHSRGSLVAPEQRATRERWCSGVTREPRECTSVNAGSEELYVGCTWPASTRAARSYT